MNQHDIKMQMQLTEEYAGRYEKVKEEIDELVFKIKNNVGKSNPANLMNFMTSINFIIALNKAKESEYDWDENILMRAVEYVQSVLVSIDNNLSRGLSEKEEENLNHVILKDTFELYKKMTQFYMCWSFARQKQSDIENEIVDYIVFSQLMSQVRGKQYQNFRIEVLAALLEPHDEEIREVYGIGGKELVDGLAALEKNLSIGRLEALDDLCKKVEQMDESGDEPITQDDFENRRELVHKAVGLALFDVKAATKWPDLLVDDLTLEIGEDTTFFSHEEFPGWPIWNLPIQSKPCVRINGIAYTFDYNNFFDNFYRVFQKAIVKRLNDGVKVWKDTQSTASERLVAQTFEKLLPGCVVHRSNYYPVNSKRRASAENDLLIEYKDVLIIVEVKAGSFTYTPALTDFIAHQKSLSTLVEKAEKQCIRTKCYIEKAQRAVFYTGNDLREESFGINYSDFSQLYMFDVTVDDFNELAAQMEKIEITDSKEDIITISINDLWVYKDYFDNPLQFIHFLKQRTIATRTREIKVYDELDHLGLYIGHNMYSIEAKEVGNGYTDVYFEGYREDIDEYYTRKWLGEHTEKPKQKLPKEFCRILEICNSKDLAQATRFTNFLLDMSSDTKDYFCENLHYLSKRESELGRMISATAFGELSYCLFVDKPGIKRISNNVQEDYVLSFLAANSNLYCYLINISLGKEDYIDDVNFKYLTQQDIPANRREELRKKGEANVERRKQSFLAQQHKKKIGRNDPCPCGSGKKYKKCCGK